MMLLCTLIVLCILEYRKAPQWTPMLLRGHRAFYVSIASGLFTGEIVALITARIMYKHRKNEAILRLANNLLGIKRCVKEICKSNKNFKDGIDEIKKLSNAIMADPDILALEREIKIEKDFIDKLRDINRGYLLKEDFENKAPLIAEYVDQYCISFLKRNRMETLGFERMLTYYNL